MNHKKIPYILLFHHIYQIIICKYECYSNSHSVQAEANGNLNKWPSLSSQTDSHEYKTYRNSILLNSCAMVCCHYRHLWRMAIDFSIYSTLFIHSQSRTIHIGLRVCSKTQKTCVAIDIPTQWIIRPISTQLKQNDFKLKHHLTSLPCYLRYINLNEINISDCFCSDNASSCCNKKPWMLWASALKTTPPILIWFCYTDIEPILRQSTSHMGLFQGSILQNW